MFKHIEIHLTSAICPCPKPDLKWCLFNESDSKKVGLKIWCGACSTIHSVPNKLFSAVFVIDGQVLPEGAETERTEKKWGHGNGVGVGKAVTTSYLDEPKL